MTYMISGSFAYDTILLHGGQFHTRILPESISRLNVSFGIEENNQEFGGTGGNIAYNASLLGDKPLLCATVGNDFADYERHLQSQGIDTSSLSRSSDKTAHAWVLTDQENNQITAFHKGAMKNMPVVPEGGHKVDFWHLAPESIGNTARLASIAQQKGVAYFFDPGQCLPAFLEGHSDPIMPLSKIVSGAKAIFVNEYESELLQEKLKKNLIDFLGENTQCIIQTLGAKGLRLYTHEGQFLVAVAKPSKIVDPTGCGDALRAGFAHAYIRNYSWQQCAELGAVMGSFAIEESGGQNHRPSLKEILDRLQTSFQWKPSPSSKMKC